MSGPDDEINLLRVYIRRVIEMGSELQDLPESLNVLRVVSLAITSLNRLLRTQHLMSGSINPVEDALNQALEEVTARLFNK